jgi:hypothetical protein
MMTERLEVRLDLLEGRVLPTLVEPLRFTPAVRQKLFEKLKPLAYQMLKNEVAYAELGADYFEHRSKTQITRRLVKRLESLGHTVEIKPAA